MDVQTACKLINNDEITFMNGWKFFATPHTNRFEASIHIHVEYPAQDTDVRYAPSYNKDIVTYADFVLTLHDCDDTQALWFKFFIRIIMKIMFHEAREYFAVKGCHYEKPFHPHTIMGMENWCHFVKTSLPDLATAIGGFDINADLQFGK